MEQGVSKGMGRLTLALIALSADKALYVQDDTGHQSQIRKIVTVH